MQVTRTDLIESLYCINNFMLGIGHRNKEDALCLTSSTSNCKALSRLQ